MSIQRRFSSKKGFTLIELMVVIVIIGILAAIAIPKLFGMTAKAKASEVGPAVGTWSKLQAAYMMENPSGMPGDKFITIGYTPPGSKVGNNSEEYTSGAFKYESQVQGAIPATDSTQGAAEKSGWKASNLIKLNDCVIDNTWIAEYKAGDDRPTTSGTYTSDNCNPLTPNFAQLR